MIYTDVNIQNELYKYHYVFGYDTSNSYTINTSQIKYSRDFVGGTNIVNIVKDGSIDYLVRKKNYWTKLNKDNLTEYNNNDSNNGPLKMSKLYLYFPQFSVDVYNQSNVKYSINLSTWIHGVYINLGTYVVSRIDALAMAPKRIFGEEYVEYIELDIIDMHDLIYGDFWKKLRTSICGDVHDVTIEPMLNIALYPVQESSEDGVEYIMLDGFQGTQNSMRFDQDHNEFFTARISIEDDENMGDVVKCQLNTSNMDEDGNLTISQLADYINDKYDFTGVGADNLTVTYDLVMKNQDEVFSLLYTYLSGGDSDISPMYFKNIGLYDVNDSTKCALEFDEGVESDQLEDPWWYWWGAYHEKNPDKPLSLQCIVTLVKTTDDRTQSILYIKSNELFVTQEIFSKFTTPDEKINLNNIKNMNLYNVNVVNKTQQIIKKYENVNDAKSNIIQPVFYKARDVNDLIIHPEVTENISINLDSFKSKVNRFIIQIEGCAFNEIGRTGSGVIFKIIGNNLPKTKTEGIYYILNEDSELITNGNYKYIM